MSLLTKNYLSLKAVKDNLTLSLIYIFIIILFLLNSQNIIANSSIISPDRPAYSYQYISIHGIASNDTSKVEIQIYQSESDTYWDGRCWVGAMHWLLCEGTTSWIYKMPTYFSDNLTYIVKSRATDKLGVTETPGNGIKFVIDFRAPYSYLTFPEHNKTYQDVPKIFGHAADSKSGVVFVRVRIKDTTDNTYWNGKEWVTSEIWLKTEGIEEFFVPVSVWKVNHEYNVVSQAIDYASIEEGIKGGINFRIISALKFSATTLKQKYLFGEPVFVKMCLDNKSNSNQLIELQSNELYDFSINSIYFYNDYKKSENIGTKINFNIGENTFLEKIEKELPVGIYKLNAQVEELKLKSSYSFEVINDTIVPNVELITVSGDQFKYFSIPISAYIYDNSNISQVVLHCGANSWQMNKTTEKLWTGKIPAEFNKTSSISYFIVAIDASGNKTESAIQTIYTKEIVAPKTEDITVDSTENNKLILGITNYADLHSTYYRVYYDRGTGTIDYSYEIGIIDKNNGTIMTEQLDSATIYRFFFVPNSDELKKYNFNIAEIPAAEVIIKTQNIFQVNEQYASEDTVIVSSENVVISDRIYTIIKIPAALYCYEPEIINIAINKNDTDINNSNILNNIYSINTNQISLVSEPVNIMLQKINNIHKNIDTKIPVIISYIDINNDGYLDGTNIKETTLVMLRYDEFESKWVGGFDTIINVEQNTCTAYVDRIGTYAVFSVLQVTPTPVSNLKGTATEKWEAKIEWEFAKSASLNQYNVFYENESYYEKSYMIKYRIYWDKGTGTINYTQPIIELKGTLNNWTSQKLNEGLYKFSVRVVDIEGNEEKNNNFVIVNINKRGDASAYIRVPSSGQKLRGNAVTVIAEATPNTSAVTIQYKGINDYNWTDICVKDNKAPYADYWDLTNLKKGEYRLRAIAYDLINLPEDIPEELTVYIDDTDWDISEYGNPEPEQNNQHIKQEKVTNSNSTEVKIADGTGAIIPAGVLEKETVLEIKTVAPNILPPSELSIEPIGVFREYNFSDNNHEFEKEITVVLPFKDENNDNIVDGTEYKVDTLEIYYLDEINNEWKIADNNSGIGDGIEQNNEESNTAENISTTTESNIGYETQNTETNITEPAVIFQIVTDTQIAPATEVVAETPVTTPDTQETVAVTQPAPDTQVAPVTESQTKPLTAEEDVIPAPATEVVAETPVTTPDTQETVAVTQPAPDTQVAPVTESQTKPLTAEEDVIPAPATEVVAETPVTTPTTQEPSDVTQNNQDNTNIEQIDTNYNKNDSNNNHSGLGDGTNPGKGQGTENSPNTGTNNNNNSINTENSENNKQNNNDNSAKKNNDVTNITENELINQSTISVTDQDTIVVAQSNTNNHSGLGDGTNPGKGQGTENSPNTGTNNPNNSTYNQTNTDKNNNNDADNKKKTTSTSSSNKTIYAKVKHFTIFGIFAKVPKNNLKNVSVYPNPFKPSRGHTQITFDGLMRDIKIKIYTIAGRLVTEFTTTTEGTYNWIPDSDLASGIYIYYIENNKGKNKTTGKIGIIR